MNEQAMSELVGLVAESIYKDAERYRWLREESDLVASAAGNGIAITHGPKSPKDMRLLDERIDALRLPPSTPKQGEGE